MEEAYQAALSGADKLFTPPAALYNVPFGVAIPKGKFLVFMEYDYGRTLQTGGLGLAYTF